jgi:hypothetical protein
MLLLIAIREHVIAEKKPSFVVIVANGRKRIGRRAIHHRGIVST